MIPDSSVAEMVLRGTLTYWFLFLILRLFRRPTGQLGIADVLLITILADASQNAMGGSYESISSGFVLIATIVFWDRPIDHLAYRYRWFTPVAEPPPAGRADTRWPRAARRSAQAQDQRRGTAFTPARARRGEPGRSAALSARKRRPHQRAAAVDSSRQQCACRGGFDSRCSAQPLDSLKPLVVPDRSHTSTVEGQRGFSPKALVPSLASTSKST